MELTASGSEYIDGMNINYKCNEDGGSHNAPDTFTIIGVVLTAGMDEHNATTDVLAYAWKCLSDDIIIKNNADESKKISFNQQQRQSSCCFI